jgi:predicted component of type VI protein secretion system
MSIKLKILRWPGSVTLDAIEADVPVTGLRIGRATDNGWALPGPEAAISPYQCVIELQSSIWVIKPISDGSTWLNAETVQSGTSHGLAHGDRIRFGDYEIAVEFIPLALGHPLPAPYHDGDPVHLSPSGIGPAAPPAIRPIEPWDEAGEKPPPTGPKKP